MACYSSYYYLDTARLGSLDSMWTILFGSIGSDSTYGYYSTRNAYSSTIHRNGSTFTTFPQYVEAIFHVDMEPETTVNPSLSERTVVLAAFEFGNIYIGVYAVQHAVTGYAGIRIAYGTFFDASFPLGDQPSSVTSAFSTDVRIGYENSTGALYVNDVFIINTYTNILNGNVWDGDSYFNTQGGLGLVLGDAEQDASNTGYGTGIGYVRNIKLFYGSLSAASGLTTCEDIIPSETFRVSVINNSGGGGGGGGSDSNSVTEIHSPSPAYIRIQDDSDYSESYTILVNILGRNSSYSNTWSLEPGQGFNVKLEGVYGSVYDINVSAIYEEP